MTLAWKGLFEEKLAFEMLTVRGQQHSFSTHERVFLAKCQSFSERKYFDLRGGTRTPNLRIHAECSNLLSYQCQTLAVPCFLTLTLTYRYFWSKVNIWNVTCAWTISFIFDTRTGVLGKVSKFLGQKMSRPEGDSNPNLRIHAECSNLLSYQGQTFAVPCYTDPAWLSLTNERKFVD